MKADVGLVYTLNAPTQPINNIELFYTLTPELTKWCQGCKITWKKTASLRASLHSPIIAEKKESLYKFYFPRTKLSPLPFSLCNHMHTYTRSQNVTHSAFVPCSHQWVPINCKINKYWPRYDMSFLWKGMFQNPNCCIFFVCFRFTLYMQNDYIQSLSKLNNNVGNCSRSEFTYG